MSSLYPFVLALALISPSVALAQPAATTQHPASLASSDRPAVPDPGVPADPGFTIGPEDVLAIVFWRDQEMSSEVIVRSDGMITLPIIRDIKAAGLTPTELADRIQESVHDFVTDASVTVVVRQMNSRKAYITGEVSRPGAYPLASSTTVMQLIAIAGGLTEFADSRSISIMRVEDGQARTFMFDYKDVARGKKGNQNLVLKPGDTVVVPEK